MSIGMTVVLMNLFVGVLGQNYEIYEDQSVALFACERAKSIVELDIGGNQMGLTKGGSAL